MVFSHPDIPFDIIADGDRIVAQSKATGNVEAASRTDLLLYALLVRIGSSVEGVELKAVESNVASADAVDAIASKLDKLVEHVEAIDKDVEPKKPSARKAS